MRAQASGHALAKDVAPGKWVLAECFGDNEDEMWLGKAVATKELDSTAVPKCKKRHTGRQQRIKGTRYDRGDWRVAVDWYERMGDDEERLIFRAPPEGPEEGAVYFFNSTELRHVLSSSDVPMAMGADGQTCTWRLSRKAGAEGRSWCRYFGFRSWQTGAGGRGGYSFLALKNKTAPK